MDTGKNKSFTAVVYDLPIAVDNWCEHVPGILKNNPE